MQKKVQFMPFLKVIELFDAKGPKMPRPVC